MKVQTQFLPDDRNVASVDNFLRWKNKILTDGNDVGPLVIIQ